MSQSNHHSTESLPLISLIVAMSKNHIIGNGDKIPWYIPEDFKYFKEKTLGKPIIMGRTTFESIHKMKGTDPLSGPCLPKRPNIIITRNRDYQPLECSIYHSLPDAIIDIVADEIMICGGGQIYKQSMDIIDRMYITIIDREVEGDTFFPQFDCEKWVLTSTDQRDGFAFNVYERKIT